jgi:hypothetical protein
MYLRRGGPPRQWRSLRVDNSRYRGLLRILEVFVQCVLVPCDALLDVGLGVREALGLTGVTAEEPVAA